MPQIILTTLNARHIHASLGLRYMLANMGDLQSETVIEEFTLEPWPIDIAEQLLQQKPKIIGIGVYIWNIEQSSRLVALLKTVSPETTIILGGPEVSYEWESQPIVEQADYLITGQGDLNFAALCRRILDQEPPVEKIIHANPPDLAQLAMPYAFYTDEDIAHRLIYVEASRGCPFKCEFCLSALDKTAWSFELSRFLAEMDQLYLRGARHYKFVDRTFNLNIKQSVAILEFFLERMDEQLFLHFEVIPDHLPDRLKTRLRQFPPGALQLEVGIQTFNPEVQALINRKQDNQKSRSNLTWLRENTHAHLHADLIIGLPGEAMDSFAESFNQLVALAPHEIQLGILKRLKGTPIIRHTNSHQMRFNPNPVYDILSTDRIDFPTMQRLTRFTRYWEMIANSGRFKNTLPAILGKTPFHRFLKLSDWLFNTTRQVHRIALKRLFELIHEGVSRQLEVDHVLLKELLNKDFQQTGIKGLPSFLINENSPQKKRPGRKNSLNSRQIRHG